MRLEFEPRAFADLHHWINTDARMAKKVMKLIEDTKRTPFSGIDWGRLRLVLEESSIDKIATEGKMPS
jgi:Txe/YoeB family toxin of Txe-Axe toxin-antitoxin module